MRVSLFITCLVDQMFPDVGEAMVMTLRRLGLQVSFNDAQTCCGQVAFNTGYRPEARSMAEHFIKVFENDPADFIVAPSGSCTAMVRNFYGELFNDPDAGEWRDRFSRVRPRLREFSEFIVNDLGVEDVGASFPHPGYLSRRLSPVAPGPLEPFAEPAGETDSASLVSRFTEEATALRAQVHRLSDKHQLVERIVELCADQAGEVTMSGAEIFREIDLPGSLAARGHSIFMGNQADHEQLVSGFAKCSVGVTAAD